MADSESQSPSISPSTSESESPSVSPSTSESVSPSSSISASVSPSTSTSVSSSTSISQSPSISPSISESISVSASPSEGSPDRYWVGGSGNWADSNHWSYYSGGSGGATVPDETRDIFVDENSGFGSGGTITIDDYCVFHDFTSTSGHTYNINDAFGANLYTYGSIVLESGVSISGYVYLEGEGNETITTNNANIDGIVMEGTGEYVLQDSLVLTYEFSQNNGTFDANDKNITADCFYFNSDVDYEPTVKMGSGNWASTSTTERTMWTVEEYNDITVTFVPETSTIIIPAYSGDYAEIINKVDDNIGGGHTYYNILFTGYDSGSSFRIGGNNTFNNIEVDTYPNTLLFCNGSTTILTTFDVSGIADNRIVLDSYINEGIDIPSGVELISNGSFTGNADGWEVGTGFSYSDNKIIYDGNTGTELITNGGFAGNANGWNLGVGWSYNDNKIIHSSGINSVTQEILGLEQAIYGVFISVGGSTGTVTISLGNDTYEAAAGDEYGWPYGFKNGSSNILTITPSNNFDGTIDNVSVKKYYLTYFSSPIDYEIGKKYRIKANIGGTTGDVGIYLFTSSVLNNINAGSGEITTDYTVTESGNGFPFLTFFNSLDFNGTIDDVSVQEIGPFPRYYLSKSSGSVVCDYLDINNSKIIGGATFLAGNNSVDGGNNEGWLFQDEISESVSPSSSISASTSPSISESSSISASISESISPSSSISASVSPSTSESISPSTSISVSPSTSTSVSPSSSISASVSPSTSISISPSQSTSISPSLSTSISPSVSASLSPSTSISISPSTSESVSPSISESTSISASISPSTSPSDSKSLSPSPSPSISSSTSVSVSPSTSISASSSESISPSSSVSFSTSPSLSPSSSVSSSTSISISPSISISVSPSLSPSPSWAPDLVSDVHNTRLIYKVYNEDGTFISILPDVISDFSITKEINGGDNEFSFTLARKIDDFSETSEISFNHRIKVYLFDNFNTTEKLIAYGYVVSYEPYLKENEEGVTVTCLSVVSKLSNDFFRSGTAAAASELGVELENMSATQMMDSIIDHYRSTQTYPMLPAPSGLEETTDNAGGAFTFTNRFFNMKHLDALREVYKYFPRNKEDGYWYYWRINTAGNLVVKNVKTTPEHKFIVGKHITEISGNKSIEGMVNRVYFWNEKGTVDPDYLKITNDDLTSQGSFDIISDYISDSSVTNPLAANLLTSSRIYDKKDPKVKVKITLNGLYDLSSIEPGQTCSIYNLKNNPFVIAGSTTDTVLVINSIEYNVDSATLELSEAADDFENIVEEERQRLDKEMTWFGFITQQLTAAQLGPANRTWSTDIEFTATTGVDKYRKVDWTAGTVYIPTSSGNDSGKRIICAGTTGLMAPNTDYYIYLNENTDSVNITATSSLSGTGVFVKGGDSFMDSTQTWTSDQWKGYIITVDGQTRLIRSNTVTVLTIEGQWTIADNATASYVIRKMSFDVTSDKDVATNYSSVVFSNVRANTKTDSGAIVVPSGSGSGNTGSVNLDGETQIAEKSISADNIIAHTLTANQISVIDAGLLSVGVLPDNGLLLDGIGLYGRHDGVTTFSISAITGEAYFRGTIEASTFIGSTFETAATGYRLKIFQDSTDGGTIQFLNDDTPFGKLVINHPVGSLGGFSLQGNGGSLLIGYGDTTQGVVGHEFYLDEYNYAYNFLSWRNSNFSEAVSFTGLVYGGEEYDLPMANNLIPYISRNYVIGSPSAEWNNIFVREIDISTMTVLSADGKYSGIVQGGIAGDALSFGNLCYFDPANGRWKLTDANAVLGASGDTRGLLGICVYPAIGVGYVTKILLWGMVRADVIFPTFTINQQLYASEDAGLITGTMPTTTDVVIRSLGFAITANAMMFNPSSDYITHI